MLIPRTSLEPGLFRRADVEGRVFQQADERGARAFGYVHEAELLRRVEIVFVE